MTGFDSKRQMAADKLHWSDCAVHNGPAYPAGKCDCGVEKVPLVEIEYTLSVAEPAQEPVAWPCLIAEADFSQDTVTLTMQCDDYKVSAHKHWLSTTPPKREWVGLTDEELADCLDMSIQKTCRAIEAKLKEKNFD